MSDRVGWLGGLDVEEEINKVKDEFGEGIGELAEFGDRGFLGVHRSLWVEWGVLSILAIGKIPGVCKALTALLS